jgi:RNA-directed DNA polymerase
MINEGDFLQSPATRSSEAATGTPRTTPACSISTTRIRATTTTTSGSADPKIQRRDGQHFADGRHILGRKSPAPSGAKARPKTAKPKTAMVPIGAMVESGSDFNRLTNLSHLHYCWRKAKKNKSGSLRVQRFGDDALRYLINIQKQLRDGSYRFGPYKSFTVQEKKFRHVIDAPIKDRVVHWMLYEYMLPIWQPRFIHDTYGNLPGRGTHAAVQRLAQFCRSPESQWVLQLDISKYFYSVNHDLLKDRVLRHIGDERLRHLLVDLVGSFVTDGQYDDLFQADSMYRRTLYKGMPIGNLSSQLFANIFLNDFDHWVKETLRVKRYIRYVDDIVITGRSIAELQKLRSLVIERMAADGLTIHPKKIRIAPVSAGVPFLGYIVWPNHISIGAYGRRRYLHRLRQHETGGYDRAESLASYAAMLSHTGSTIYRVPA